MKTNRNKRIVFAVIALLLLLFIWGQSILPVSSSAAESGWLRSRIVNPLLKLAGIGSVSDHAVRKAAHIAEFLALSLFIVLFFRGRVVLAFPVCFVAAFLDETIQLFSDRGAQVMDVWIDLIGVMLGTIIGVALMRDRRKS